MPPVQYWFTGTALVALVGATASLGFGWYRAAVTEQESAGSKVEAGAQKARTERVKALLGTALRNGEHLLIEIAKYEGQDAERDAVAQQEAEQWATPVHDLIAVAYGDGEAALFLSDSGMVFYGGGRVANWIRGRIRRITDLIPRADTLPVRSAFDSRKFD
jgi:hypothetical protein